MTTQEFKKLLTADREAAVESVLRDFVRGCQDDGLDEIARVLTVWATHVEPRSYPQLDLGDDETILEHARHYGTVSDADQTNELDAEPAAIRSWCKAAGLWHVIAKITGPAYQPTRTCLTKCGRSVEAGSRTLIDLPQTRKTGRKLCRACLATLAKRYEDRL